MWSILEFNGRMPSVKMWEEYHETEEFAVEAIHEALGMRRANYKLFHLEKTTDIPKVFSDAKVVYKYQHTHFVLTEHHLG